MYRHILPSRQIPETLKPGQKGIIEGTFDATKNQSWGNVTDMVKVEDQWSGRPESLLCGIGKSC